MKLPALLASLVVLAASPAFAETFGFVLPGAISLQEEQETFLESADLRISDKRIDAPFGVRLESSTEFATAVPVLLGARYVVKDANGDQHQLRIRNVIDGEMFIDLKRADREDATRRTVQPGRFKLAKFIVSGAQIAVAYPDLILNPDGTYRLGAATGRYDQQNQALLLGGHYAEWGPGEIRQRGEKVTFDFARGTGRVKAVFERADDGATSVAASR